ncbi:MAG: adenine deaminase [Bacteroidales bacterium]|nr:adenine deaminase [Bacteroidales bacterium]
MEVRGHIVDVAGKRIYDGEVHFENGKISGIVPAPVPDGAPFIMPGFVDAHIHIESTLLTPANFASMAVSKGVVAVVTDPHEIANVAGLDGIRFMVENGRNTGFHFNFCVPSCVPCTGFETSGAVIDHSDIATLLQSGDFCALAEFMNAFGVLTGDEECIAKLEAAKRAGKSIDGHAPGLGREELMKYAAAGISTDHECVSLEEALNHLDAGMLVIIREGSASCDFEALSPLLADHPDELMFCSDDKYPDELMEGYIDRMVQRSVAKGYPLWNVLNAACVTPVRHYGLKHGLLRPGDGADFITVDNLRDFNVLSTYVDGVQVYPVTDIDSRHSSPSDTPVRCPDNFRAEKISTEDIRVSTSGRDVPGIRVIDARNLSIRTGSLHMAPKIADGCIISDPDRDILKIVVYSRYGHSSPRTAFIHGFGFSGGAIASSIAHDSHNIVAIGSDDRDIVASINRLIELKGGLVVSGGGHIDELPLPVGGLMSDSDCISVAQRYRLLKERVAGMGCKFSAAFMTLSFMCLPVIPELKLTDKGLFDVTRFAFTDIFPDKVEVGPLFDSISHSYDRFNHLLSLNTDKRWRRRAIKPLSHVDSLLDVAAGTADLSIEAARQGKAASIVGIDISTGMLAIGEDKVRKAGLQDIVSLMEASALEMPFADGSFGSVICAYGVRNFSDLDKGLREMHRVLSDGGELMILEFSYPSNPVIRAVYDIFFSKLMPLVGKALSRNAEAYKYFRDSVKGFIWGKEMAGRIEAAGFRDVSFRTMTFGITTVYYARK